MGKIPADVCCEIENTGRQIGEKAFYTFASRLLCEIAANTAGSNSDSEILVLCDVQGDGSSIRFLRIVTADGAGVITTVDVELDGVTPYVVTGTVDPCADSVQVTSETLCVQESFAEQINNLIVITATGNGTIQEYSLANPISTVGASYTGAIPGGGFGITISLDKTETYSLLGGVVGSQKVETVNWLTKTTISNFNISGLVSLVTNERLVDFQTHPITGDIWAMSKGDSGTPFRLYILDPTTGVCSLQGVSPYVGWTNSEGGFCFDRDLNLFVTGRLTSPNHTIRKFDFATLTDLGEVISGTSNFSGLEITQRQTLLVKGAPLKEYDFQGNLLNTYALGGAFNHDNLAIVPLNNSTVTVGQTINKVCIVDDSGTILNCLYYDLDGNLLDLSGVPVGECCCEDKSPQIISETLCVQDSFAEQINNLIVFTGATPGVAQEYSLASPPATTGASFTTAVAGAGYGVCLSLDKTKLYLLNGSVVGSQRIETVDWLTKTTISNFAISGLLNNMANERIVGLQTHPITGDIWAMTKGDLGNGFHLYIVDPTTGVCTFQRLSPYTNWNNNQGGFAFDRNLNLFVAGFTVTPAQYQIRKFDFTTLGDLGLVVGSGSNLQGIEATQRQTLLVQGTPLREYDYSGTLVKTHTLGVVFNHENFAAVPVGNSTVTVGQSINRVCKIDYLGQIENCIDYDLDGNVLDLTGVPLGECCCEPEEGMIVLGREILAVGAASVGLAVIPVGAEGAEIQVQITVGGPAGIRFFTDGGAAPTAILGRRALDLSTIYLGIVREIFGGDPKQLSQFRAIGEAGVTASLIVTYYRRT